MVSTNHFCFDVNPDFFFFLPLELVLFVPDVISLIVGKQLSDASCQVAVDAVHVAGRGHDGAHVSVAVVDTFFHLSDIKHFTVSFLQVQV